jgi:hypothetical protein
MNSRNQAARKECIMTNDPTPEQGSAGQLSSDKTPFDRREARRSIERVFGIKDPVEVTITDSQGHRSSYFLADGYRWDKATDVSKCCLFGPASDGTSATALRVEDMPGPDDVCAGL